MGKKILQHNLHRALKLKAATVTLHPAEQKRKSARRRSVGEVQKKRARRSLSMGSRASAELKGRPKGSSPSNQSASMLDGCSRWSQAYIHRSQNWRVPFAIHQACGLMCRAGEFATVSHCSHLRSCTENPALIALLFWEDIGSLFSISGLCSLYSTGYHTASGTVLRVGNCLLLTSILESAILTTRQLEER